MIRTIVTSATYRQSSKTRKELEGRDPDNALLARQSRLRLPAELIRDEALFAGDLLTLQVGGKSVRPPQPAGVAALAYGAKGDESWVESKGPDKYRRGLYIHFQRATPYPLMANFDAPRAVVAQCTRERTDTPLQALNLLNDPVFFEAAQGLATRIIREMPGAVDGRVDYAFRLSIARDPSKREKDRLLRYYEQQKVLMLRDPETAEKLYPANGIEGVDRTEAAAWVSVSTVLLNLDEFITRN